jgi:hypothetical protein
MSDAALIVTFWGGVLAGLLLGGAVGWWRGLPAGVGVGCLVIGLGGVIAAAGFGWKSWQFVQQSDLAQGVVIEWQRDRPIIEFRSRDGTLRRVTALGGSRPPEGAVPVRYLTSDPSQAVLADFQNLWGGALAFTLFGALPLAFGLFFTGLAFHEARPRRHRPAATAKPSPRRAQLGSNLTAAANLILLAGLASGFFIDDTEPGAGFGRTFLVIATGVGVHGVAFLMRRQGDWQAPAICFIIALGFGLFGGVAMLIG